MALSNLQANPMKGAAEALIKRLPVPPPAPDSLVEPTKDKPEELDDVPLSRQQVEDILFEIRRQPNWRREADKAADYYDGNQLDADAVQKLEDRGQPPLITNLIKPTIDTVLGMETKTRTDWIVRPDDDGACEPDLADAMTVKLKHAEVECRADRACSDAYAAQIKAGLGWVEISRDTDPFNPNYRVAYVHRREIDWDWRSEKADLSDARYLVRRRWVDVDHAIGLMPQYADLFRHSVNQWMGFDPMIDQPTGLIRSFHEGRDTRLEQADWADPMRKRVCLNEIWYRKWVKGYVMMLANGRVIEFNLNNPMHCQALLSGYAKVREATFQRVRLAWYCGPHYLYDIPSPYNHNHFPYVPFFGYREDLTLAPYGLIRSMMSPQDEINARKSKQLWLLNSRRVIADADAVDDHEKAQEEVARPDSYIMLNPNRRPNSAFKVEDGAALAPSQGQALQEAKSEIEQASGVAKAMMGQTSAASSGLAINSLVDQGITTLAEINDNFTFARRQVGVQLFAMLQEDLSGAPVPVKLGSGASERVVVLNQPAQDPQTGAPTVVNDVSKLRATIVLDDVKSTPTYRMQVMTQLTEITKSLPPNAQGALADLWVEASDLPGKQQVIDRLRVALNLPDDSPQGKQQAAQAQQQKQQQDQQQYQLEVQLKTANIAKINADAQKLQADSKAILSDIESVPNVPLEEHQRAIAQASAQSDAERQSMLQQIQSLQAQLKQREIDASNRQAEIALKENEPIIKGRAAIEQTRITADAHIKAAQEAKEAQIRTAEINADVEKKLEPILKMVDELRKQVDVLKKTPDTHHT